MILIDKFEREIRGKLKGKDQDDKVYLKKNYVYEIFQRHSIHDEEINFLFNPKKIIRIYPNLAFPEERVDIEVNVSKGRTIKIILMFDPIIRGEKQRGKIGIITSFKV